jgi:signal transduction histidine kinase
MEPSPTQELAALAAFLKTRRDAVLHAWEEMVHRDPEANVGVTLSATHLRDVLTEILEDFERRLGAGDAREEEHSLEHGSHRWQQGYSLRELVREWGYLQRCMMAELERYALDHPGLAPGTMTFARRVWLDLCGKSIEGSVARFAELQKAEAAGVLYDLQQAVASVRESERRRAEAWHEAAHDLRGNVGVVTTTTSILAQEGAPEALRAKAVGILQTGVSSLLDLLEDLMSLARLEAGREHRKLETFDAAAHLRQLCRSLEPMASEKGLFLKAEGPESLRVEGDRTKVQRIVQNLILNGIKYTAAGGVTISWAESAERDADRWILRVEDTGPGFHEAPGSPLAAELREATETGRRVEALYPVSGVEPMPAAGAPADPPPLMRPGEGIGLLIVKRLCELLDAEMSLSSTQEGTTFQVTLPRRYSV